MSSPVSQRVSANRRKRTDLHGARRVDLILSSQAGLALEELAAAKNCSLTEAVESLLLKRRTTPPKRRGVQPLQAAIELSQRKTWFQFVMLRLGLSRVSDLQRRTGHDAYGGGQLGRLSRGERAPTVAVLREFENLVPGSSEAYLRGPFGSDLWVALTETSTPDLLKIVAANSPTASQAMEGPTEFPVVVRAFIADSNECAPLRSDDLSIPTSATRPGADLDHVRKVFGLLAAWIAMVRIARLGLHPRRTTNTLHIHAIKFLRSRLVGDALTIVPNEASLTQWLHAP